VGEAGSVRGVAVAGAVGEAGSGRGVASGALAQAPNSRPTSTNATDLLTLQVSTCPRRLAALAYSQGMEAQLIDELETDLQIVPATSFYRLTEAEFGSPGLVAIESVGPFVELAQVGPFITVHDSFLDPGLGIGHHPHHGNERLFYILEGEIQHDDSLNGIQGVMNEGDLARLTEGEVGMLHREWNGRDDVRTHAFILVYPADPPLERAAFNALRAADVIRLAEGDGVETLQLIGGRSSFGATNGAILSFFDTFLEEDSAVEIEMGPREGLLLYPLQGAVELHAGQERQELLRGASRMHPEGPDELAIAWSGGLSRSLGLRTAEGPARLLRIGFARGPNDFVSRQPWRSRE
jgi:redox-sensitive bicupin YhaK (pirin superfamily)